MPQIYSNGDQTNELTVNHIEQCGVPAGHCYVVLGENYFKAIRFQNGSLVVNGVNGLTNESLLAIMIHRTQELNKLFPCEENKTAISHMEQALQAFNKRAADRKARGVEGQLVK